MELYEKYLITERLFDASAVENWLRDQLSGTKRKTTARIMLQAAKRHFNGIGGDQFMNVWNDLIQDGFLILIGGDSYKWEM